MSDREGLDDRIIGGPATDPCAGIVKWSPAKSLLFNGMAVGWLVGGALYFSWSAVLVFIVFTAITLCFGHSLGMHRKFIHNSFECPLWMEWVGVYLGTLVGLGGPRTMIYTHDMRDWAQRQPDCHGFLAHRSHWLKDAWWQLNCKLHLDHPPEFVVPNRLARDRVFGFLEATSVWQQVPWAVLFFTMGGWGFVAWGVCGRVTVSIFGHWLIGYIAHNHGHRDWHVEGAAAQGHNVPFCGLITFGECWHNNHHAFPESARIGLHGWQHDPGWWVLQVLQRMGLVWELRLPADLPERAELRELESGISLASKALSFRGSRKREPGITYELKS